MLRQRRRGKMAGAMFARWRKAQSPALLGGFVDFTQFAFFLYVTVFLAFGKPYRPWHLLATFLTYVAAMIASFSGAESRLRRTVGTIACAGGGLIVLGAALSRSLATHVAVLAGVLTLAIATVAFARALPGPHGYVRIVFVRQVSFMLPLIAGWLRLAELVVVPNGALAKLYGPAAVLWLMYRGIREGEVGPWNPVPVLFGLSLISIAAGVIQLVFANVLS